MKSFENGEFPEIGEVIRLFRGQQPLSYFGISNVVVFIGKINATVILIQSHDSIKETTTIPIEGLSWEPHFSESGQLCHSTSIDWHDS